MISAWRIVKRKHARAAFSGEGARLAGGRWNSAGTAVVYVSSSAALAMLEMLVHLGIEAALDHYVLFEVRFASSAVEILDGGDLPRGWKRSPPSVATMRVGDAWVREARSAVLRVPSAVVPTEHNYLLNPAHPQCAHLWRGPRQPVRIDPRLLQR